MGMYHRVIGYASKCIAYWTHRRGHHWLLHLEPVKDHARIATWSCKGCGEVRVERRFGFVPGCGSLTHFAGLTIEDQGIPVDIDTRNPEHIAKQNEIAAIAFKKWDLANPCHDRGMLRFKTPPA